MKNVASLIFISAITLSFFMSGCSMKETGNQNLKGVSVVEIQERIVEGKTTKKEILEWLGEPSTISKDKDGNEHYSYHMTNFESKVKASSFIPIIGGFVGGTDYKQEQKMLSITMKNNIVTAYSFSNENLQ